MLYEYVTTLMNSNELGLQGAQNLSYRLVKKRQFAHYGMLPSHPSVTGRGFARARASLICEVAF